jgi:hypothetical protein
MVLVITFFIILLKYYDKIQVRLIIYLVLIDKTDFDATYMNICFLTISTTYFSHTPQFSLHSASPRLRTCESMHLVCSWHLPTSMAKREHHLCAPGVRWWVRTVRFCVWKRCISMRNTPIIAAFGITPSLHRRTTAPSLLLAFAHIHGEVSTPIFRTRSAAVGPDGPVLSVEGVHSMQNTPVIAAFGITPSPHRRTTTPRLLLAFAHIHGEAGTPSLRTRSVVVGPDGPVLCVEGITIHTCRGCR